MITLSEKELYFEVFHKPMISFLSLITFLLRLTLAIQSQVSLVIPAENDQERICFDFSVQNYQVHAVISTESGKEIGRIETENEEKNESESESLADLLDSLYAKSLNLEVSHYYDPFFGNKAQLGDRQLYDFFHSWKIHLS